MDNSVEAWLACIDIPSFSLQVLLRTHPTWREIPTVVVDEDKPLGNILAVNSPAEERGIRRGMRYATALAIVSTLQAGVVSPEEMNTGVSSIITTLQRFSPVVEHADFDPQSFWIDGNGMYRLFAGRSEWIRGIRDALKEIDFFSTVALGYTRFGTYVGARLSRGARIFSRQIQEERAMEEASVDLLPLDARTAQRLHDLGISTIGTFRAISSNEIRRKLGEAAFRVHAFAVSRNELPLQGEAETPELRFEQDLQPPVLSRDRLLVTVDRLLETLHHHLLVHAQAVQVLTIFLLFENREELHTHVRPAKATQDPLLLRRLLSLRLESTEISAGLVRVSLEPVCIPLRLETGELFPQQSSRNLDAASRALALLCAELGEGAVRHAEIVDAHLPEERFSWQPLSHTRVPAVSVVAPDSHPGGRSRPEPKLVRRLLSTPVPLFDRPRLRGGPYVLNRAWWRAPGRRTYYFAELEERLLWTYVDAGNRRWMIQGFVE